MDKFYNEIFHKLSASTNEFETEANYSVHLVESLINLIIECLAELKEYVQKNHFKSTDEEIHFFKVQKPSIVSKLIYYNRIYKIETNKPQGTKLIERHLNEELKKLKKYFDSNLDLYRYYRTGSTHLDDKYFLRGKYDIKLGLDSHYFVSDPEFSTSHDYKVARIMANDLLQIYLENQLRQNNQIITSNNFSLSWTDSKTSLTELIYALHAQGVFNQGHADIKFIAKTFENAFNIDLGDFYHTFMELKSRKMNYTKFLDKLRDALVKKMEEHES